MPSYKPRLDSSGMEGSPYYYGSNPFSAAGFGLPNCTCYAWGRRYEITGKRPTLSTGNADTWVDRNTVYEVGMTPKLGAVCCWKYTGSMAGEGGHVAVVEQINPDGSIVTSNSAWGGSYFYLQTLYPSNGYEWGNFTAFQGFIYAEENYTNGLSFDRWIPG